MSMTVPGTWAQEKAGWTVEKSAQIRSVTELDLSPDGTQLLYALRSYDITPGSSGTFTSWWLLTIADGSTRQLALNEDDCSSASWSPDGSSIACVRQVNGAANIWLIDPADGSMRQLTDEKMGVGRYIWSPRGDAIAFTQPDMPDFSSQQARAGIIVVGEQETTLNLRLVEVTGDGTAPSRALTHEDAVVMTFDWSPDGSRIVYSKQPVADQDYLYDNDLFMIDIAGGKVSKLVTQPGWDIAPLFSPDGSLISFNSMHGSSDRNIHRYFSHLAVVSPDGGEPRYLQVTRNELPGTICWASDGSGVYYEETKGTSVGIYKMPVDGGEPVEVVCPDRGVAGPIDFARNDSVYAYVLQTTDTPGDIWLHDGNSDAPDRRITAINAELLASVTYAPSEVITWKGRFGDEIQGILTYPLHYKKGEKYPLLLIAHAGLFHYDENDTARLNSYPVQSFAAAGFMVLRPNPHGSNNQTRAFRDAIIEDWGGITYDDNMAGVDELIRRGLIDPQRMGVMGWSTGGYETATIISRTNRFAAASIGAAPVNLVSFTNTTDSSRWLPEFFGVEVCDDQTPYLEQSPLFRMTDVRATVLLQWGVNDRRVPLSQGYELYNWLKEKGVAVTLQLIPKSGHGPTDPRLLVAVSNENLAFFTKHLLNRNTQEK